MVNKILNVYLTPSQIKKYKEKGELNLSSNIFSKEPNYSLHLDGKICSEINKLKNTDKKYKVINTQQMVGGFLPIIPILAGLAAATTIGKNIYDAVENKKINNSIRESILSSKVNNMLKESNRVVMKGSAISLNNKKILR